jgi:hypothetical protein
MFGLNVVRYYYIEGKGKMQLIPAGDFNGGAAVLGLGIVGGLSASLISGKPQKAVMKNKDR